MIHQVYITNNPSPVALDKIEKVKANYEHRLWNDADVRELLENNFEPDVIWAYDELIPYSFKADLAKFAIIYIHGGWYLDVSFSILPGIDKYVDGKPIFFKDTIDRYVSCSMFYAPPGNKNLKKAIDIIVSNCKSKHYGVHPVDCTGPGALGKAFDYSTENCKGALMMINEVFCQVIDNTLIGRGKKNGQHGSMAYLGDHSGGNYRHLWNIRQVYKSELK